MLCWWRKLIFWLLYTSVKFKFIVFCLKYSCIRTSRVQSFYERLLSYCVACCPKYTAFMHLQLQQLPTVRGTGVGNKCVVSVTRFCLGWFHIAVKTSEKKYVLNKNPKYCLFTNAIYPSDFNLGSAVQYVSNFLLLKQESDI